MRDYLNIGSVPCDEECAQTGVTADYESKQRKECLAFKHQLQRLWPGGDFAIKRFPHDFGPYLEVVAYFDGERPDSPASKAAWEAEANTPEKWDEEARKELEQ